jgi:hypothetical protein
MHHHPCHHPCHRLDRQQRLISMWSEELTGFMLNVSQILHRGTQTQALQIVQIFEQNETLLEIMRLADGIEVYLDAIYRFLMYFVLPFVKGEPSPHNHMGFGTLLCGAATLTRRLELLESEEGRKVFMDTVIRYRKPMDGHRNDSFDSSLSTSSTNYPFNNSVLSTFPPSDSFKHVLSTPCPRLL